MDHSDQGVFNYTPEQLRCDVKLLVRILREEFVLLKQVLDHTEEYIGLPLHTACLELSE